MCCGFVYGVLVVVAVAVVVVVAVDNDVVRQQLERRKSVFDEGKILTENLKIVFVVKIHGKNAKTTATIRTAALPTTLCLLFLLLWKSGINFNKKTENKTGNCFCFTGR